MYRSYRGQGFSPWMGIVGLLVLLFLFSKGLWFLPFIFMFGLFMMRKGGHHHRRFHQRRYWEYDEFEKRKNDAYDKRKHDERFDEYKRKNDAGEDVYYV